MGLISESFLGLVSNSASRMKPLINPGRFLPWRIATNAMTKTRHTAATTVAAGSRAGIKRSGQITAQIIIKTVKEETGNDAASSPGRELKARMAITRTPAETISAARRLAWWLAPGRQQSQ